MHDLNDFLVPRPEAANDPPPQPQPPVWEPADGEGPDRLFNRYRRLRLQALAESAA
jgi:hypothetical protein